MKFHPLFHKSLTVEKVVQNWVQFEGDVCDLCEEGMMFPQGAYKYIDELAQVIPISDGTIMTTLVIGCGVCLKHIP